MGESALESLNEQLVKTAYDLAGPGSAGDARARPVDPVDLARAAGSMTLSGEQPNALSPTKRQEFVDVTRKTSWSVLVVAALLGVGVPVLDLVLEDRDVSSVWVIAVIGLSTTGVVLWAMAYLTVMGFGKVALSAGLGEGGKKEDGQPKRGSETGGPNQDP